MALSTYLANKLLDHAIGKTAFTLPATVFMGLFTSNPTAANTGTEAAFTGYARASIPAATFAAATAGGSSNANAIPFPSMTAGTSQVIGWWATFDASSVGNMLEFGALGSTVTYQVGGTETFNTGGLSRTAA